MTLAVDLPNSLRTNDLCDDNSCSRCGQPSTAALDVFVGRAEIELVPFEADATGVHHVEFGYAEWRRNFVLYDFGFYALADNHFAILELSNPANIDSARRIEFQSATTGRGFRRTIGHAPNLFTDLIDEDHTRLALGDNAR